MTIQTTFVLRPRSKSALTHAFERNRRRLWKAGRLLTEVETKDFGVAQDLLIDR